MKRTFIAVKTSLSEENFELYSGIKSKLKDSFINWVDKDNLHLTLFFLGDTTENQILEISKKLNEILTDFSSFDFSLHGMGVFKNMHDPRVIWFGIDKDKELKSLKGIIDKVITSVGFESEEREFRPHLTIGRIKNLKQKNELKELLEKYRDHEFQKIQIKEVIFYESILTPRGPIYKPIQRFFLK